MSDVVLYHGDCLEVLRGMLDSSIDSIVTDPPYGLSFMGKKWDHDVPSVEIWAECLRVLKPGGHLLAFAGTRTQHRMAVRIEDAGFEIRDMIAWVYGSGFPKSHNGEWGGTALKPAIEPITMARKPLIGTVASNVQAFGTGALNIDGCRVPSEVMPPNTGAGGLPRRREQEDRGPGEVSQPHELGRWPANLIHDGSDEVLAAFPEAKGQQGDLLGHSRDRKSTGIYGDFSAARDAMRRNDSGSAARFFYCPKASRRDRNDGTDTLPQRIGGMISNTSVQHITRRDDGYVAKPQGNSHPTVKPTELMAYLCRLVTPLGGVVLDPFMGSRSTGKAAKREGFGFVGIEREAEYVAIARARMECGSTAAHGEDRFIHESQIDLFEEVAHA